jgi:FtsP/CotA-like multicopper oxidase with cupredoxin domain
VQRWRLVASQYQDNMLLELDKHRLNVIACDGIQLGALQEMKQLLIAPGQRADVLVHAGGPGTYELNALPFDQGHPSPTGPLARVVVAGEPLPMTLPAALPKPPLEPIRDSEITGGGRWSWGPLRRRTMLQATGKNSLSPWTARSSIPRASTSGCGWARWSNGRSETPTSMMTKCSISTPIRSGRRDQRSAAGRSGVAGYRGRAAAGQRRQRRHPLAVPRLHRRLHAALSHDEPRGDGHDAGGRGARLLRDNSRV